MKQNEKYGILVDNGSRYLGAVNFSSENYWKNESNYPLDLNEYDIPSTVTSVVNTAKAYGMKLGGSGRLLTKEEANSLSADIRFRDGTQKTAEQNNYKMYWLSIATGSNKIYHVNGHSEAWSDVTYNLVGHCLGVRPVIEISKNIIIKN